ncbi:uncharacterized protein LOC124892238 [Capsicum annuum]|uniref:uncharacterized protein LOC124892238 n=1 Tax=Capsicum annuum TaxID=4072 RepID=UPI001FB10084|nr:uncharacterized protein LOC124892238 [Capsicum annuum]
MKSIHGLGNNQSVKYEELCAFLEIELPPDYKIPKFEKFDGSGNPLFYLKTYCENLIGVGRNEGIRVNPFSKSLSGKALEWYAKQDVTKWHTWDDLANAFVDHYKFQVDIKPVRISITKLRWRSSEIFCEYAICLREEVTKFFKRLKDVKLLHPNKQCAYHTGAVGYDTEKYITLKHKLQDSIDNKVITLEESPANVNNNPLPNHNK